MTVYVHPWEGIYMTTTTATTTRYIATCKKCNVTRSYLADREPNSRGMDTRWTTCSCGKAQLAKAVAGQVSDKLCDDRCTTAASHKCSCSCGGENHGAEFGGLR